MSEENIVNLKAQIGKLKGQLTRAKNYIVSLESVVEEALNVVDDIRGTKSYAEKRLCKAIDSTREALAKMEGGG